MRVRKGLFNFINDIPLNSKFLMIYVLCVLIPILTINLLFWNRISSDIKERERENFNISINRVTADISSIIDGCVDVSHSVSSDKYLFEMLERHYESDAKYYEVYHDLLRDKINRYLPIYNDVKEIAIYTGNDSIDSGGNYYFIDQAVKNTSWYKDLHGMSNRIGLFTYVGKSSYGGGNYVQYLSILRRLNEYAFSSNRHEQILKIDIDMNKFYEMFYRERDYLHLFLVDSQNRIVCSTDGRYEQDLSKGYTNFDSISNGKENESYFYRTFGNRKSMMGWKLVGKPNDNRIFYANRESYFSIACIIVVVTLISSLLIWIIVRSYNYRLKKLHKHMRGVGNENFDLIEIAQGKDEIGELVLSFNRMTSKVNTLINDVYKLRLKKKDLEIQRVQAELNFLQSQIDPHFLFNTLNAVMAVCVRNNYTDLTEVIKYLSKIFRRLISWKDDLVAVGEEISFIEMYLKIEKFRFQDKFDYEIEVEEKVRDLKVPKMSIQTLVENACKHGIQNTTGIRVVKIKVSIKDDFLYVEVEDNGAGIEEDKLRDIIEAMHEEDDCGENVGIRNVYKRLHLYYGSDVEFSIESELNKGTRVRYGINMNVININRYHDFNIN